MNERGGTMLHPVMSASARGRRRVLRLCVVVLALVCATMVSALVAPTKAEAKRLTVKLEITNLDEHPEIKDRPFTYVCSFFPWQGFVSAGWWLNPGTGQWKWLPLDSDWVSGPDDHDSRYWHNLSLKPGQSQSVDVGDKNSCFYFYPVISPFATKTDPGLSLTEIEYTGNTWKIGYDDNRHGPEGIVPFNMGGFVTNNDGSVTLKMRYDTGLPKPPGKKYELALETKKKIDYLGDGHPNPDTPLNGPNDYRVYLSGTTIDNTKYEGYKKKNIILALDRSLSMYYSFDGRKDGSKARWESLKKAANRLMDGLGGSELGNTFSVISFSSDDDYGGGYKGLGTTTHVKNTSVDAARSIINNEKVFYPSPNGGTDYYSAFEHISDCCVSDRENIVLFITDGEPTSLPKKVLKRLMGSTAQSVITTAYTRDAAGKYINGKIKSFYSVFIGTNQGSASVLNMITRATNISNDERASVQASNDQQMQQLIDDLTKRLKKPTIGVAMEDTLSQYVTYMNKAKVTAQEEGQAPVDLTPGADYTLDQSGKTLKLVIKKPAKKKTTYTLSYDVNSDPGIPFYKALGNSYPNMGDDDTDYDTSNPTSSMRGGFFSSTKAVGQITYDIGAGSESMDYEFPKPVVQVKYAEGAKGLIGGHVTLYNQELKANRFSFNLMDDSEKVIKIAQNDEKGDFQFPEIEYNKDEDVGTHTFTLRQATPSDLDEKGFSSSEKMQYTPVMKGSEHNYCEFKVTVTVTKVSDDAYKADVTYTNPEDGSVTSDAHFYNTYGVQGTYQ